MIQACSWRPFPVFVASNTWLLDSRHPGRISDIRRWSPGIRRSKNSGPALAAPRIRCPSRRLSPRAVDPGGDAGGNRNFARVRCGPRIVQPAAGCGIFRSQANCAASTPTSPRASGDVRSRHEQSSIGQQGIRAQRRTGLVAGAHPVCSRTPRLYCLDFSQMIGQSPGLSVGKPPPTGSIPNANSLSRSLSCDEDSQRPAQEIPVECLQMPQVKNQPVALRNRPVVKRIRRQQLE